MVENFALKNFRYGAAYQIANCSEDKQKRVTYLGCIKLVVTF